MAASLKSRIFESQENAPTLPNDRKQLNSPIRVMARSLKFINVAQLVLWAVMDYHKRCWLSRL